MAETELKHTKTNGPHWEELTTLAVNPGGTVCAVGGQRPGDYPSSVHGYDPHKGKHLFSLGDLDSPATALLFLDDEQLVTGHANGDVCTWDLSKKSPKRSKHGQISLGSVTSLAYMEASQTLYVGGDDGSLLVCPVKTLKAQDTVFAWPEGEAIHAVVTDPHGGWVAAAGDDGVIRVYSTDGGEPTRQMEGHDGPIYAMILHPQEYRLISAGEDRSIRLWYLQGDVEFEDRAAKQSHDGPIRCMALGPTFLDDNGEAIPPRLLTGGDDGAIKIWPLANKRAPKTLSGGNSAILAVGVIGLEESSLVMTVNPARVLAGWTLNRESEPVGEHLTVFSTFHNLRYRLRSKQAKERAEALKDLTEHLEDPAVFSAILKVLQNDAEVDLRVQAVEAITGVQHRRPIKELREALNDNHTKVRKAAFASLRKLQGETSIGPMESALSSNYEDTRRLAIQALTPLQKESPQASRLIRQSLQDRSVSVQKEALNALETLYPSTPKQPDPTPLLIALSEGTQDLQLEALYRIHRYNWSHLPQLHTPLVQLLDHSLKDLRHTAYRVMIAGTPALAEPLQVLDENLARQLETLEEQVAEAESAGKKKTKASSKKKVSQKESDAAWEKLQQLSDQEKRPLLLGQSSRDSELALHSAVLLARMQDLRAFGSLLQLSQESDSNTRKETALAFRYLSDTRALHCLSQLLDDNVQEVRDTAFDSFAALVNDPAEIAQAALQSTHADIRHRALQKLLPGKKGGELSAQAATLLENALSDSDTSVRNEAFKILWNAFSKDPQRPLLAAIHSQRTEMREKAIDEIATSFGKSEWGQRALLDALHDPQEKIRQRAYTALDKIFAKDDYTAQLEALKTSDTALRLQALKQLHKAKKDVLQPVLLGLLNDPESEVRQDALGRLLQKYPSDNDTFVQALDAPHWDIRLQVAQHLANRGDARALEVAADYLTEEKQKLAEFANIYPTTPEQSILEVLPAQEQTRIRELRRKIIELVLALGTAKGIPYLEPFLDDPDHTLALQAIHAIAQCADGAQRDLLVRYLKDQRKAAQEHARQGLARLGELLVLPALSEQLAKGDESQQRKALVALHALGSAGQSKVIQTLAHNKQILRDDAWLLVLATECHTARLGQSPLHLLQAMSSYHPELRLRAAELLEQRANREAFEQALFAGILQLFSLDSSEQSAEEVNKQKEKLEKFLPTWVAHLTADLSAQRYAAASLLALRHDPKEFLKQCTHQLRHWDNTALPAMQPDEAALPAVQCQQLAFGAYAGLLRQELPNPLLLRTLQRVAALAKQEAFDASTLQPLLEQLIQHPDRSELRKAAWQHLYQLDASDHSEAYRLAIASQYADVGLLALQMISQEKQKAARTWTAEALQSNVRDVRQKAAEQLQNLYPEDSLDPFIIALQSDHTDVRLRVIDRLLRADDARVTEALSQALSSDHEDLRLKAAEALAQRKVASAFDVLVSFLDSENSYTQQRAVQSLLQLGDPRAVQAFIRRYDEDPEQTADKGLLLRSLGTLGHEDAADWLVMQLEDSNYQLRRSAYQSLLALAGPAEKRDQKAYLRYLERALQSKQADILEQTMDALASIKDQQVADKISPLLRSREESVRRKACTTLIARIPEHEDDFGPLHEALASRDPYIRLEAAIQLGSHGHAEAFPILFTAFQTSMDAYEQRRAIDALGKLGDARAFAPILAMFPKDDEVHPALDAAAEAVGRLAPKEQQADIRQLLLAVLKEGQQPPEALELVPDLYTTVDTGIRCRAVAGLRHVAGKDAIPLLAQIARESEGWSGWQVRQAVAQELGKMEDKQTEPTLLLLMQDDDSDVQRAAAASLLKLHGEDHPRPNLLIFDSDAFQYDYDMQDKAAKIIAQHAAPVDILERLPLLVSLSSSQDLFLDTSPQPGGHYEEDDIPNHRQELTQILEKGLLRRDPPPVESTLEALSHDKLHVRLNALQILLRMLPAPGEKASFKVPTKAIAKALQQANQSAIALWQEGKKDPEMLAQYWELALWSMGQMVPDAAVTSACEALALADAPPNVRAQAAQTIGQSKTSSPEATAALQTALSDPQEKVRRQAAWALSQIQTDTTEQLTHLPALPSASFHLLSPAKVSQPSVVQTLGSHTAKRELLPSLIARGESSVFIEMFQQATDTQDDKLLAIDALGRIADPNAISQLDQWRTANDQPTDVRVAAYRAWRRAKRQAERRA